MASASEPKTLREAILFFADYENCHKAVDSDPLAGWRSQVPAPAARTRSRYLATQRRCKCYGKHPQSAVLAQGRHHLRGLRRSVSKSGCPRSGCSPTARTASAATNWPRARRHPENRVVHAVAAFGSRLQMRGRREDRRRTSKSMKPTSAARRATCTTRSASALGISERKLDGRQGRRHGLAGAARQGRRSQVRTVRAREPQDASTCSRIVREHVDRRRDRLHRRAQVVRPAWQSRLTSTTSSTTPRRYVDGQVHTNGCENFWSLLKRAIKGTYVSVEPFHLFRYLDEQAFRFNNRKGTDAMRFALALKGIINKRLTYTRPHRLGVAANVLKKPSRNSSADVPDVRADEPDRAMIRFTNGLRRVLAASKAEISVARLRRDPTVDTCSGANPRKPSGAKSRSGPKR